MLYRIINNKNNSNGVIKKFVNETFHAENDYLFQLNPLQFEIVPSYVVIKCDEDIRRMYPRDFLANNNEKTVDLSARTLASRHRIRLFELPASAGDGHWIDDTDYTEITVEEADCDFAAYISGDSMEPKITDKSIVLVKHDIDMREGEIGIFNINGEIYCKQLGDGCMVSLNSKYSPILFNEYDEIRLQGKVIKVIHPDTINSEVEFIDKEQDES